MTSATGPKGTYLHHRQLSDLLPQPLGCFGPGSLKVTGLDAGHAHHIQTAPASQHMWDAEPEQGPACCRDVPNPQTPWIPTCDDQHAHTGRLMLTARPTKAWLTSTASSIDIDLDQPPADPTPRELTPPLERGSVVLSQCRY